MASILDAYNEAVNEKLIIAKIAVYAIPIYLTANSYLKGDTNGLIFWGSILSFIVLSLVTLGINNVKRGEHEILSFNLVKLFLAGIKSLAVVVPYVLVLGFIGKWLTSVNVPVNIENFNEILHIIVWVILLGIVITAYLAYAKNLNILHGFKLKAICESCIDVMLRLVFFAVVFTLINVCLIGPIAGAVYYFNIPFTHPGFVVYCCAIGVIDISMIANYLSQLAYEQIKGVNEDYNENVRMDIIDDQFVDDAINAKKDKSKYMK